jgi:accessory gene regulator B
MIHQLSEIIADFLLKKNIISETEYDIYTYGYESIMLGIIDLLIVLTTGLIFNEIIAMLLFFIMFILVRIYCGGYHANTVLKCKLIFILICLCEVSLLKINFPWYFHIISMILYLLSCIFLSPIINENKPLTIEEQTKYKKTSIVLSLIWTIIAAFFYFFETKYCTTITITAFCITLLMVIGKYGKEKKANG